MTDLDDQQRFASFVNDFEEEEYEKYIDGEMATWSDDSEHKASDKQRDLALQIRTPASDLENDQVEQEQTAEEERTGSRVEVLEPEEVYDNRDLPPRYETRTIEIPRDGSPARVLPKQTLTSRIQSQQQQVPQYTTVQTPTVPSQPQPQIAQPRITMTGVGTKPVRQSIRQRVTTGIRTRISSFFNRFRRNR